MTALANRDPQGANCVCAACDLSLLVLSKVQPQAFTIILDNVRDFCFSTAKCNPINLRHCQNHNKRPLIFRKKRGPVHDVCRYISSKRNTSCSPEPKISTTSLLWQVTAGRGMLLATCEQKAVTTDFVLCRALCYFRATKVDERKTLKRNQVVCLRLKTAVI